MGCGASSNAIPFTAVVAGMLIRNSATMSAMPPPPAPPTGAAPPGDAGAAPTTPLLENSPPPSGAPPPAVITTDAGQLLQGKIKLVFFAANFGPAQNFAQVYLANFINKMKADKDKPMFECILVTWDRDPAQFHQLLATGPWWAVPYEDMQRRTQLNFLFQVQTVPWLVVLDEDDNIITQDGVQQVVQDFSGRGFPWRPSKVAAAGGMMMGMLLE